MNALHKILSLIFVQAILVISSFLVVAHIELQHSSYGKLIDVTGKNRLLASTVQLEMYRTLFHESEMHMNVETAIEELEHNTELLYSSIMGGNDILPLPQGLHSELDEMGVVVDQYTTVLTEMINSKNGLTYDNVESVHTLGNKIIEIANNMNEQLSTHLNDITTHNSLLLILLGIANITVLTFITFLVRRITRSYVDKTVQMERFEVLGKFSATMAHNIRNPLGSLLNSVELIKKSNLDTPLNKETARMERSIKRISHQIESILTFVNNTPLNLHSVMLLEILHNAVDMLTLPKNIDLHIPDDDQNINVECDNKKMEFVFYNLLSNAVQAIGHNQGRIVVRIRDEDVETGNKNGTVILEFANSGPSIPSHVLPHMFDPLFTTKKDGTGLGLTYCKNIVKLHKGSITTSNQNGLVLFSIYIPKTQTFSSTDTGGVVRRV